MHKPGTENERGMDKSGERKRGTEKKNGKEPFPRTGGQSAIRGPLSPVRKLVPL